MNNIVKRFLLLSSLYLMTTGANAVNLNDTLSAGTAALSSAMDVSGDAQQLVGLLQNQLDVTETQAAGGTSALLQLASSELGGDTISALSDKASGLSGLLGNDGNLGNSLLSGISSMEGVQAAFSALGMDSAMVQQFIPIVLGFLGEQGVGSSLLGQLQGLWAPAS